jgi:hypothetical protein
MAIAVGFSGRSSGLVSAEILIDADNPDDDQWSVPMLCFTGGLEATRMMPDPQSAPSFEACWLMVNSYQSDLKPTALATMRSRPQKIGAALPLIVGTCSVDFIVYPMIVTNRSKYLSGLTCET